MLPIHVLQRLFFLVNVLLNQHGHREEFDHLNEDAIQEMDNMLATMARYDIREVFRQIIAGDYTLLEHLEDAHGLRQYSNTLHHGNPVQQENIEGRSENDNVMAQETHQWEDESNESGRDTQERLRNVASSQRSRSHGDHQPGRYSDLRLKRVRADQGESRARERYFAQPVGLFQPEEPDNEPPRNRAQTAHCSICGRHIQILQDSRLVWQIIIESVQRLTRQQFQKFVTAANEYTGGVLDYQMQARDILDRLQRWNVNEDPKCVLCLLNYAFQRAGRVDLAEQIRGTFE
ncbi:uncharacterized protein LOC114517890 [Dendronephthya gigantea]|uniref:uncharacterized protein LOC114517890 n=1 Tax=Dendronephthya gigantea TaxID=151771 RepID=UPI00106C8260|nr:uncharacterized protein LOC114517890 [Dendronephthya gigantea]XP_028393536.1 uncharacterized protein LOC114517890 [Dendronephthya gigantea]